MVKKIADKERQQTRQLENVLLTDSWGPAPSIIIPCEPLILMTHLNRFRRHTGVHLLGSICIWIPDFRKTTITQFEAIVFFSMSSQDSILGLDQQIRCLEAPFKESVMT